MRKLTVFTLIICFLLLSYSASAKTLDQKFNSVLRHLIVKFTSQSEDNPFYGINSEHPEEVNWNCEYVHDVVYHVYTMNLEFPDKLKNERKQRLYDALIEIAKLVKSAEKSDSDTYKEFVLSIIIEKLQDAVDKTLF